MGMGYGYISMSDAAKVANVSRQTIWRWAISGKLRTTVISGRKLVNSRSLFAQAMKSRDEEDGSSGDYADILWERMADVEGLNLDAIQPEWTRWREPDRNYLDRARWARKLQGNNRPFKRLVAAMSNYADALGVYAASLDDPHNPGRPSPEAVRFLKHRMRRYVTERQDALLLQMREVRE